MLPRGANLPPTPQLAGSSPVMQPERVRRSSAPPRPAHGGTGSAETELLQLVLHKDSVHARVGCSRPRPAHRAHRPDRSSAALVRAG